MEGFYVMAFATVSASLRAEKMALGRFRTVVIPTPGEISRDCGFALRFLDGGREELVRFLGEMPVRAALYTLGERRKDGRRECTCVGSNFIRKVEEHDLS